MPTNKRHQKRPLLALLSRSVHLGVENSQMSAHRRDATELPHLTSLPLSTRFSSGTQKTPLGLLSLSQSWRCDLYSICTSLSNVKKAARAGMATQIKGRNF